MIDKPGIETLRRQLDKYIETNHLSDVDVLRIFERGDMKNGHKFTYQKDRKDIK